eukprot:m.260514 g.260514  ORF g.260514 m.260514 type:complete len:520 (-) comp40030_c0_seq1:106-1665(-)
MGWVDDLAWDIEAFAVRAHTTQEMLIGTIVALVVVWITRALLRKERRDVMLSDIPKPPGSLPFFGHALQLGAGTPWEVCHEFVKKYGDKEKGNMVAMDFLLDTGVIITDPNHIRHIFDKKQRNYSKDVELAYKPFLEILGKGLVTSSGDNWKRQRKLVSGAFRIDILEETADVAKRAVDRLSIKLEKIRGTGKSVEICEEFRVMTLQVIGELILSLSPEEAERVFPDLYLPIVTEANIRIWQPWRQYIPNRTNYNYHKTVGRLNDYVSNLVRERWKLHRSGKKIEKQDILDRVLLAIDPSTWGEHTVRQLCDEIKTFLLAGHETSASMLTWSLLELIKNPTVLEKTLQEGKSAFKEGCRDSTNSKDPFSGVALPTHQSLKTTLNYTVNVLKESLRLYTLVPMVTRICDEDDEIDGQRIPAGSKMFMLLKATHMDERFWPNPTEFRPERFESEFDIYNFNAFINGPRNCLGQHLALLESRIVLSLLVQRFKFSIASEDSVKVHPYMVPTCPEHGMHVFVN